MNVIRFFVRKIPLRIVRHYEDGTTSQTEIFNADNYTWKKVAGLYYRIVGLGGDSDYREMTLNQARDMIGAVTPEHFSRADKYLFLDLPADTVKNAVTYRKDLIIK